jgi:hypothetical protein
MKRIAITTVLTATLVAGFLWSGPSRANAAQNPQVEVVFVLDTTGSMGGLIEGAKQKIWSIANQIVRGKPTPDLKIGLVGYRDYGDLYVTRMYPLNDDLDAVFENLMSFRADGGGDTPEHVNRALHDALYGISWSTSLETLKIIFLVGDCPPHMDYDDGYDYREIARDAVMQDIIINTIQCGDYVETVSYWRDIARRGEGNYATVAQEGGMQIIETPYDEELAMLNGMLEETVVSYGSSEHRLKSEKRKEEVKAMAPSVAAERAAYKSADSSISSYDLIDAIDAGIVKLKDLKDGDLPREMRRMSMDEKKAYLEEIELERETLKSQIAKLGEQRTNYINERLKESGGEDSFDEVVQRFIEEQAAEKGIHY